MKSIIFTLAMMTSISTFANDLDCKLLKGVSIGAKAITVELSGVGYSEYHMRAFVILRDAGNKLSSLLRDELVPELSNKKLEKAVFSIASSLDNSTQTGSGDAYYWAQLSSIKAKELQNATNSLSDLADITCSL
jgi:hypothetical protein